MSKENEAVNACKAAIESIDYAEVAIKKVLESTEKNRVYFKAMRARDALKGMLVMAEEAETCAEY